MLLSRAEGKGSGGERRANVDVGGERGHRVRSELEGAGRALCVDDAVEEGEEVRREAVGAGDAETCPTNSGGQR